MKYIELSTVVRMFLICLVNLILFDGCYRIPRVTLEYTRFILIYRQYKFIGNNERITLELPGIILIFLMVINPKNVII